MNNTYLRGIYLRLAGVVTLVVMLALAANAYVSHQIFERALAPQLASKVASVGFSIRGLVARAVENGVDFRELYGVTARFKEIKEEAPEISFIAITDKQGRLMYHGKQPPPGTAEHFRKAEVLKLLETPNAVGPVAQVGALYVVSMPLAAPDQVLGMLHLAVDVGFIDDIVLDMLYDVLVVLIVTLFVTLELLHFIAGAKLEASLRELSDTFERGALGNFSTRRRVRGEQAFGSLLGMLESTLVRINTAFAALSSDVEAGRRSPAHERPAGLAAAQAGVQALSQNYRFGIDDNDARNDDSQLAQIRSPLFMFILAEELTRSFLPAFTKDLLVPVAGLSPQLVIGLPIALFMLIVAIGQPFFGVYCERHGHRKTMLTGAMIAAVGFFASAMAASVLDLLLWRSLCAVGYAMIFVAGQAYVLDHSTPANRPRGFALFVGAIMAATVCGPSIGGILADNIGIRAAFGVAGALAVGSLWVIRLLPAATPPAVDRPAARIPTLREIGSLMLNRRFMMVTGLAAMPAKILLTGAMFYLTPLYVLSVGSTQSMAGRVLMTYGVMMVLLAPLTAGLATTRERMHWLVGSGLLVSGLGAMLLLAGSGVLWVFLAVVLIGVGQSMSISAQSALVAEHCEEEIARLGEGVVYGVYRLLERIGNALGPLIAAVLVLAMDYRMGFVAIGAAVFLCGVGFVLATRRGATPALATAST